MPSATISMTRRLMREVEMYGDNAMSDSFSQSCRDLIKCGLAYKKEQVARIEAAKVDRKKGT